MIKSLLENLIKNNKNQNTLPKYTDYIFYLINPFNLFRTDDTHDTPMKLNTDLKRANSAPARICTKCKKVHVKKRRKT